MQPSPRDGVPVVFQERVVELAAVLLAAVLQGALRRAQARREPVFHELAGVAHESRNLQAKLLGFHFRQLGVLVAIDEVLQHQLSASPACVSHELVARVLVDRCRGSREWKPSDPTTTALSGARLEKFRVSESQLNARRSSLRVSLYLLGSNVLLMQEGEPNMLRKLGS